MAGSSPCWGCCTQLHLPPLPHSPQTNKGTAHLKLTPISGTTELLSLKWLYPDTLFTVFFSLTCFSVRANVIFNTKKHYFAAEVWVCFVKQPRDFERKRPQESFAFT